MHPYSEAYYRREPHSMAALNPCAIGRLTLTRERGPRPASGYMYGDAQRAPLQKMPVLRLDGKVWMSLTPMEVQSSFKAIRLAHGRVGTGGQGLGYFVQRVLDKPEVEQVVVYEVREEVLELYDRTFGPIGSSSCVTPTHGCWKMSTGTSFMPTAIADCSRCRASATWPRCAARIGSAGTTGGPIEQAVLEVVCAGLAHRLLAWMLATYLPFLQAFVQYTSPEPVQVFGCGQSLVEELEQHGLAAARPEPVRPQYIRGLASSA